MLPSPLRAGRLAAVGLLVGLLAAPPSLPAKVPPYRDNPRPVELAITPELRFSRILVLLSEPPRARVIVLPGAGEHPTLRAKSAGRALPQPVRIGAHLGRFGVDRRQRLQLFWTHGEHYHARIRWPGPGRRASLHALAEQVSELMQADTASAWLDFTRRLPEGSHVEILLAEAPAELRLYSGPGGAQAARRAFERELRIPRDWQALPGLHSPAFRGGEQGPGVALLLAGPILAKARGPDAKTALRTAARLIRRPLPPAPEVPDLTPREPGRAP